MTGKVGFGLPDDFDSPPPPKPPTITFCDGLGREATMCFEPEFNIKLSPGLTMTDAADLFMRAVEAHVEQNGMRLVRDK